MDWSKWFYYDESSPTGLRWAVQRRGGGDYRLLVVDVGDVAGCIHKGRGYGEVKLDGKSYKTHRVIYELHFGEIPAGIDIDHIDGIRLNNTPSNLRLVRDKQNAQNRVKRYDNTSGTTGVVRMCNTTKNTSRHYWMAKWTNLNGKECSKSFRIDILGSDEAYRLACEHRQSMIDIMVLQGGHYTDRHGKELYCSKQN